jgi:predicted secreted protein
MINKKFFFALAAGMLLVVSGLWAGDTATFVDLGFSPDGRTFMFAQYGVQSRTLKPWADLFVVDIPMNTFVSGGRVSFINDSPVVSGQDGSGALYGLIAKNAGLAERNRINYCLQGQPLYVAIDGALPSETVEFRDFESSTSYRASLIFHSEGSGASMASSFYINLERIARDGSRKVYTVGTPQLKRPLIQSYRIKKVMIAPHNGSMILVIEMKRQNGGDVDIRYMVEALRL